MVTVPIKAILRDTFGNLLSGATYTFYSQLNPTSGPCVLDLNTATNLGTAVTDTNGVATIQASLPSPDTFCIFAVFAGSGNYGASEGYSSYSTTGGGASTSVTVFVQNITLAPDGMSASATITGQLTTSTGGIGGASLTLSLNGSALGPAVITDGSGNYSTPITGLPLGTDTIKVQYAGVPNVYLPGSSSSTFTVGVVAQKFSAGVGVGAAVLITAMIAGGYAYFRWKKRR